MFRGSRARLLQTTVSCLALLACRSTHLTIHAEVPAPLQPAGIAVRVFSPERDACDEFDLDVGQTDAKGRLHLWSEACGSVRIVASRAGLYPQERSLDTCDRGLVDFQLQAWPEPQTHPDDSAALATQVFFARLIAQDWAALETLVGDPTEVALYRAPGGVQRVSAATGQLAHPWRIEVVAVNGVESARTVDVDLAYDDGCASKWRVALELRADRWLVVATTPIVPPRLASKP
jgi:hypothetical protein